MIAEYDGSCTLLREFIYGPGIDEPICLVDKANGDETYYYLFDGLGSVAALCDVNNVLMERYTYDVFGRPTIRDVNGTEISASAVDNPYLFTGRRYDGEAGPLLLQLSEGALMEPRDIRVLKEMQQAIIAFQSKGRGIRYLADRLLMLRDQLQFEDDVWFHEMTKQIATLDSASTYVPISDEPAKQSDAATATAIDRLQRLIEDKLA